LMSCPAWMIFVTDLTTCKLGFSAVLWCVCVHVCSALVCIHCCVEAGFKAALYMSLQWMKKLINRSRHVTEEDFVLSERKCWVFSFLLAGIFLYKYYNLSLQILQIEPSVKICGIGGPTSLTGPFLAAGKGILRYSVPKWLTVS
jgi:hypothetical protein